MMTRIYNRWLNNTNNAPCKAISKEACGQVPHNFFWNFAAKLLTQIGDRLINPKTTLVWMCNTLGVPSFFDGILVPLRESGSMLPQIFIALWVRNKSIRKHIWALGNALQAVFILLLAIVPATLEGLAAGWAITGAVAGFSLSRGLSSIAAKDVLGKTIPKSRRGLLNGWVSSSGGLLALLAGAALLLPGEWSNLGKTEYTWILSMGAGLWLLSVLLIEGIREFPDKYPTDQTPETEENDPFSKLSLLTKDSSFRNFVIVRALAIGSGLSAPYIISLSHEALNGHSFWLGIFILVDGASAMLSSPFWGRMSDRSSKFVLTFAMSITTLLLLTVGLLALFGIDGLFATITYPLVFFLLGIAHSGVRLGRKTYIVDMAEGNKRTDYVSVSNTIIGLLLLIMGTITSLVSLLSVPVAILVFGACGGLGSILAKRLPDVSD